MLRTTNNKKQRNKKMSEYFECPVCGDSVVNGECVECDYTSDMTDDEIEAYRDDFERAFDSEPILCEC